ncbi:hypothetical protein [Streptomyces sp. CB03911]|uniref:hypothetical protein n=1 Tax=Streptomyces sp. CB03911 TaxID=1804758 RepID=UPI0018FEFF30|nr:hypothetical protein [Streptomyces sp. CB03911]
MSGPMPPKPAPSRLFDLYEEIGPPTDEQLRRIVALMRLTTPGSRPAKATTEAA